MSEYQPMEISKLISLLWGKLMMETRYQSAMLAALLGYVVSREQGDDELANGSMSLMFKAVDELRNQSGKGSTRGDVEKAACSFCGRSEPEVRLAAGARGFICDSCVATLNEAFGSKTDA